MLAPKLLVVFASATTSLWTTAALALTPLPAAQPEDNVPQARPESPPPPGSLARSGEGASPSGGSASTTEGRNAPITAVTLYPGLASITRTMKVSAGATELRFSGLPQDFDMQQLRAEASEGIRIGQLVALDVATTDARNPRESALEAKIQALQDERGQIEAQRDAQSMVLEFIASLQYGESRGQPTGQDNGKDKDNDKDAAGGAAKAAIQKSATPAAEGSSRGRVLPDARGIAGLVDVIGRSAGDALGRMQTLNVQIREQDRRIEALQRDLERVRGSGRGTRDIVVQLRAERAGELRITYPMANAGWRPAYRAALDSTSSRLVLERMATIQQRTGESWDKVRLVLSTAQPRQSPAAAEPSPWILNWNPPQETRRKSATAETMELAPPPPAPVAPAIRARAAGEEEEQPITFQQIESAYATEFVVPAAASVPSDGREIQVGLSSQTLEVKQYLRVAPRLEQRATVMAEAPRPEGVWLPGQIQLVRDGSHVGAMQWNPQKLERLQFAFGRDERLLVRVDEVSGQDGSTGIFDKRNERRLQHRFTLTNQRPRPIEVLMLESSPVSASDQVEVKARLEPKPDVDPWEDRRGVVGWRRTLAPNESMKVSTDYVIGWPREGRISGMR